MKKLMFTAAVAAGLAAFGTGIESANTVGYNTKTLEAGKFAIVAVQFEATDGTTDINKIVDGLTGVAYDESFAFRATAPHIQVPNASGGYDLYYYLTDGYYIDGNNQEAYKAGWCDQFGTIAGNTAANAFVDGTLISGVAIWAKDVQNSGTLQQAGQVPTENVTISAPATFALRAHVYPIAFNLNDSSKISYEGLTPGVYDDAFAFRATAPHIQVPNASGGYDLYYYLSDGYYIDDNNQEAYKAGWCDQFGTIAGNVAANAFVSGDVPAGIGFWTKGVGSSFSITFKK